MSAIRIDEPCHEDWQQMNATERGAFCQKCSIDVYDFSKMNPGQIKLVLKENTGQHLCGRFEKKQLHELNLEFDTWKQNQPATFQSRFVFALLLVFGLTLFSCEEEDAKKIAALNAIELKSSLAEPEEKLADQLFFFQDALIADAMVTQLESELIDEIQFHVMGEMIAPPTDVIIPEDHLREMVAGGPMIDYRYIEYLNQPPDTTTESTLPDPVYSVYNPFETKLFPNPTSDASRFLIYVNEKAQFLIEVYSISGQKVEELYSGDLVEGRHDFQVDMTEFNPGTYLIKVWSEKQQETVKLLKVE